MFRRALPDYFARHFFFMLVKQDQQKLELSTTGTAWTSRCVGGVTFATVPYTRNQAACVKRGSSVPHSRTDVGSPAMSDVDMRHAERCNVVSNTHVDRKIYVNHVLQ